jgi:hypothetical protein
MNKTTLKIAKLQKVYDKLIDTHAYLYHNFNFNDRMDINLLTSFSKTITKTQKIVKKMVDYVYKKQKGE